MSKLVGELKRDHSEIFETLNKVKSLGITSGEGQKTLIAAKSSLLAHLKKEDEQLYPVLHNTAVVDGNLKRTLNVFAKDMDEISEAALNFFTKHSTGGSGIEFAKEFGVLYATLSQKQTRRRGRTRTRITRRGSRKNGSSHQC